MNSNLISAIEYVLTTANVPLALLCFIVAGFQLRAEGGVNFDANGSFFRWVGWGAVLLTLPEITTWLANEHIGHAAISFSSGASASYSQYITTALSDFAINVVLDRLVPVAAGALVVKALMDSAEGHTPLSSIVSALFLLGMSGFWTSAQQWGSGSDQYQTIDFFTSMLSWAMTQVCPVLGVICFYSAILEHVKGGSWARLAVTGTAFLGVSGIWTLVQGWVGVSGF